MPQPHAPATSPLPSLDGRRALLVEELRRQMRSIQPRLPEHWPDAAHFQRELRLDSLDLVELIARMEQATGVLVENEDIQFLVSIDAIADYLLARMP